MKVTVISLTEEARDQRDGRDILRIDIDGKEVFQVSDGEPEDANLNRDFNDCYAIPVLMAEAHAAAMIGAPIIITRKFVGLDEI